MVSAKKSRSLFITRLSGERLTAVLLWALAAGLFAAFALRALLTAWFTHSLWRLTGAGEVALALVVPVTFALASGFLVLLSGRATSAPQWWKSAIIALLLVPQVFLAAYSRWQGLLGDVLLGLVLGCLSGVLVWRVVAALPLAAKAQRRLFWVVLLALQPILSFLPPAQWELTQNELGLVSAPPNTTNTIDFSGSPFKDNYPVCNFDYNSFGFRDIEPEEREARDERVLIVGDSFVWGDGIPDAEGTIGHLLRESLEKIAPGRYSVVAAGFAGLNLYGYVRFVERLQPALDASIVVVGYLGSSDYPAVDPQALADGMPKNALLTNLMRRLRVPPLVHAGTHQMTRLFPVRAMQRRFADSMLARLEAHAAAHGYRLVLLRYHWKEYPGPEGVETFDLPEELYYSGQADENWYALDHHPKPLLNERIAELLAPQLHHSTR